MCKCGKYNERGQRNNIINSKEMNKKQMILIKKRFNLLVVVYYNGKQLFSLKVRNNNTITYEITKQGGKNSILTPKLIRTHGSQLSGPPYQAWILAQNK